MSFPFHLLFFHFNDTHANPGPGFSCWTQHQTLPGQAPPSNLLYIGRMFLKSDFHCSFLGSEAFYGGSCSRTQISLLHPALKTSLRQIRHHHLSNLTSYFTFQTLSLPTDRALHLPKQPDSFPPPSFPGSPPWRKYVPAFLHPARLKTPLCHDLIPQGPDHSDRLLLRPPSAGPHWYLAECLSLVHHRVPCSRDTRLLAWERLRISNQFRNRKGTCLKALLGIQLIPYRSIKTGTFQRGLLSHLT